MASWFPSTQSHLPSITYLGIEKEYYTSSHGDWCLERAFQAMQTTKRTKTTGVSRCKTQVFAHIMVFVTGVDSYEPFYEEEPSEDPSAGRNQKTRR